MSVNLAEPTVLEVAPQALENDLSRFQVLKNLLQDKIIDTAAVVGAFITSGEAGVDEPTIALELDEHDDGALNRDLVTQTKTPKERLSLGKKIRRGVATVIFGTTALGTASEVYTDSPLTLPDAIISYATNEACEAAPEEDIALNSDAMDDPEDPRHATWREFSNISSRLSFYEETDVALTDLAAENGLTIVARAPYAERIEQAETTDQVVSILKEYLSNYGIDFNILDSKSVNEIGLNIDLLDIHAGDSEAQLKTRDRLKEITQYFFDELYLVPTELMDYVGIKEVKVGGPITLNGRPTTALASYLNKRLYLDINTVNKFHISHEIGHFLDLKFCGLNGLYDNNDPRFKSLMTRDPESGEFVNKPWYEIRNATFHDLDSPPEVKADFYAQILNGSVPRAQAPDINNEFIELFSRMSHMPEGRSVMRYYRSLWDKDVYDREKGTQVVPVYFERSS